ncbi:unnamed protein product, partial [Ceratitis capitata]
KSSLRNNRQLNPAGASIDNRVCQNVLYNLFICLPNYNTIPSATKKDDSDSADASNDFLESELDDEED